MRHKQWPVVSVVGLSGMCVRYLSPFYRFTPAIVQPNVPVSRTELTKFLLKLCVISVVGKHSTRGSKSVRKRGKNGVVYFTLLYLYQ